jgi:hypothetical protein
VAEVAAACLLDGVVVDLDDLVQVACDNHGDLVELVEVELATLVVDKGREGKRSQVAHGYLIGCSELDNLSAKVGAADRAKVLLVALPVASILVEHEGVTSLSLGLEDGVPKLLGTNSLATLVLALVAGVELLKLITVDIGKTRALVGAHECPLTVLLHALHEEIGDPKGVEEVASTNLLLAVVLTQVKEAEDVGVPWLEVDGKGTGALVATLVDIASSVVVNAEHGNETIRCSVGSTNV